MMLHSFIHVLSNSHGFCTNWTFAACLNINLAEAAERVNKEQHGNNCAIAATMRQMTELQIMI